VFAVRAISLRLISGYMIYNESMTRSARAVWGRDIYLYSRVWLVIYAIFVAREGVMIHGDGGKERRKRFQVVNQTRE